MAKSRSQPVNLPGAWPLMNPLHITCKGEYVLCMRCPVKLHPQQLKKIGKKIQEQGVIDFTKETFSVIYEKKTTAKFSL